jgi:hypothetical protein
MGKGFNGESLSRALHSIVQSEPERVFSFSEIVSAVKKRGTWADDTIWQNLMAHVRNLVPAKYHWNEYQERFLFLHPDGRYELYNPEIHPEVIE